MTDQFDLFDERAAPAPAPTAEIIAFPIDRELMFVRDTARQIERRDGALADKYWRTTCNRLYGRLQVQGFDEEQITREIARFTDAVQRELQRAAWAQWQANNPAGGDAA